MEIKGSNVKLTPSEAEWIEVHMRTVDRAVARRAIAARCLAAMPYISSSLFEGVAAFPSDIEPRLSDAHFAHAQHYYRAERLLQEAERVYAVRPDGTELHTVELTMTKEELVTLWMEAKSRYQASLGSATSSDETPPSAMGVPGEVNVRADLLRGGLSEEDNQILQANTFASDFRNMQITAGMISAIETALGSGK